MLREYEFTIIASAQLGEGGEAQLLEKYEKIFLADGGEIVRKSDWGTRKLAFPIKKQYRGKYVHYDFVGKPENLKETERLMRIDDDILRYMSVRIGENVDVEQRKSEIAKAEVEAAAAKENRSK